MKSFQPLAFLFFVSILLSGCELAGDILEFGVWLGIIIVVLVIALVLWIIRKIRR